MTENFKRLDNAPVLGAFLVENESNKIEVKEFESPMFGKIRVAGTSEKPLFCLGDVCNALGYKNSREALRKHVEEDDVTKRDTIDKLGRNQKVTFVTEGGLYSLIFGSKVDGAKAFKRWVTSEVLPSIRKTGAYGLPNFNDPVVAARAWADAVEKNRNLALENQKQQQMLLESNETIKRKQAENDQLKDERRKDEPYTIFGKAMVGCTKSNIYVDHLAKIITQNGFELPTS